MSNEQDLGALAEFVAEQAEAKNDPRCPAHERFQTAATMILSEAGVPIVMGGAAVDFGHLVELSKVVHAETLEVATLQAVVDLFASKFEAVDMVDLLWLGKMHIRIAHPGVVLVETSHVRADGARDLVMQSAWKAQRHHFDEWLSVANFSTWLLSAFDPNDDSEQLYQALGRGVKYEAAREASDGKDGIEFRTKEGVSVEWSDGIGPRFNLKYICTFPEVSQPERACILRPGKTADGIRVKLVDADGGAWRWKAIASIAEWLKANEELKGVTILG